MATSGDRCPHCKRRYKRSNAVNALYWARLHEIAEKLRPEGNSYSAEQWHTYFRSRFLGCNDILMPNMRTITIPKSTANLDTAEFGEYLDKVEAWAATRDVWLADKEDEA